MMSGGGGGGGDKVFYSIRSFLDFDPVGVGSASVVVNASRSVAHAKRVGTFRLTSSMRFSGHIDESCIKNRGTHTVPTRVDRGGDLSQSIVCVYSMKICVDTTVQFLGGGRGGHFRVCTFVCVYSLMNVSIGMPFRVELNWRDEGGVRIRLPKPGAVGGSVVF
jgi:hypothetical protein